MPLSAYLFICSDAKQTLTEDPQCLSDLGKRLRSSRVWTETCSLMTLLVFWEVAAQNTLLVRLLIEIFHVVIIQFVVSREMGDDGWY